MGQLLEFANNHPLLSAGIVAMSLAIIFYEIRLKGQALLQVTTAQAVTLINQGARVVDVREQGAFEAAHILDAINLPADSLAKSPDKTQLKKKKPVLLVCDTGMISSRCVNGLRQAGFETVFSLQGGLDGWRRDNLPVVSG